MAKRSCAPLCSGDDAMMREGWDRLCPDAFRQTASIFERMGHALSRYVPILASRQGPVAGYKKR